MSKYWYQFGNIKATVEAQNKDLLFGSITVKTQ